jgi:hypothetical protein
MPFRIIAHQNGGSRVQTRVLAASAAVLAMAWIDQGLQGVKIEFEGRAYDLIAFRKRFLSAGDAQGWAYVSTRPARAQDRG